MRLLSARPLRVAPYFDTGTGRCEVHEVDAAPDAGPLAVAPLPKLDPTDHPGFLTAPTVTVVLTGLAPSNGLRLWSRCVAGGEVWRWELPWSEVTTAATLRYPRHSAADHPPEVVRVMGTHVTLRVRNPGEWAVCTRVVRVLQTRLLARTSVRICCSRCLACVPCSPFLSACGRGCGSVASVAHFVPDDPLLAFGASAVCVEPPGRALASVC
jgi:hypothetical protein